MLGLLDTCYSDTRTVVIAVVVCQTDPHRLTTTPVVVVVDVDVVFVVVCFRYGDVMSWRL
jgi:hypothetical protein